MTTKQQVRPQDVLSLTINLEGFHGFDMATVAGREKVRESMARQVEAQIEAFFETVEVLEK